MDLSVFPDDVRNEVDGNWGEPVLMEHDFSIEEKLDMSVMGNEIGETKVSADKEQIPKYSYSANKESQGEKIRRELFCVTEKDLDYIDIDDFY